MEEEELSDLASRIPSGAVVYRSPPDSNEQWEPAGAVLRVDIDEPESEARFFLVTPELELIPMGDLAVVPGDFAVDLEANFIHQLEVPLPLGDAVGALGIRIAPDALAALEADQLVAEVPMTSRAFPRMGNVSDLQYFTFTGTCTKCAPHKPHIPSKCPMCPSSSRCNWD